MFFQIPGNSIFRPLFLHRLRSTQRDFFGRLLRHRNSLLQDLRTAVENSICRYVHRSLADHLGQCISRVRPTLFRTALCDVVSTGSDFCSFEHAIKSAAGQCHLHLVLRPTSQILGTRLQNSSSGPFEYTHVVASRTQPWS